MRAPAIAVLVCAATMAGMESNGEPLLCRRHVAAGLAFWAIYCFVAVGLRGVRWDEQYEFAQVITRAVVYPDGHPYPYCVQNALNLQIYATAALDWLTENPAVVCGFRNVLYLLATVAPVYLLGGCVADASKAGPRKAGTDTISKLPEIESVELVKKGSSCFRAAKSRDKHDFQTAGNRVSGSGEKGEQLFQGREKQGQTRFPNCRKSSQSLFFASESFLGWL